MVLHCWVSFALPVSNGAADPPALVLLPRCHVVLPPANLASAVDKLDNAIGRWLATTNPARPYHDSIVVVKFQARPYARPVRPRSFDEVLRGVARSVKSARRDLGISQEEAAHRAGIPVRQWQRVEAADAWTIRTLVGVASALGVDAGELLRR